MDEVYSEIAIAFKFLVEASDDFATRLILHPEVCNKLAKLLFNQNENIRRNVLKIYTEVTSKVDEKIIRSIHTPDIRDGLLDCLRSKLVLIRTWAFFTMNNLILNDQETRLQYVQNDKVLGELFRTLLEPTCPETLAFEAGLVLANLFNHTLEKELDEFIRKGYLRNIVDIGLVWKGRKKILNCVAKALENILQAKEEYSTNNIPNAAYIELKTHPDIDRLMEEFLNMVGNTRSCQIVQIYQHFAETDEIFESN